MNHKERLLNGYLIYSAISLPLAAVEMPLTAAVLFVTCYAAGAIADGLGKNPLQKLLSIVRDE